MKKEEYRSTHFSLEDMADEDLLKAEHEEIMGAHALIVRHGYSQSNAGEKCIAPGATLLTEIGHQQAQHLAKFLPASPQRIIHSPFIRTKLTADPTIERFPNVEILEWPIYEFTYLNPTKYSMSTNEERKPARDLYWETADPEYCDGEGAESLVTLWKRVIDFREQLAELSPGSIIFSHGQFIRMLIMQMKLGYTQPDSKTMRDFRALEHDLPVCNTARAAIDSAMQIGELKVSHLPSKLIT